MSSWLRNNRKPIKRVFKNNTVSHIELPPKDIHYYALMADIVNKLNNTENNIREIPKIAFTFWEGKEFSYLHYLTVKSFSLYNPDFQIIIYSSINSEELNNNWNTNEHNNSIKNNIVDISMLSDLPNVKFIKVDLTVYFPDYPNINNLSPVYKSDILRIIKLKEHGGIWFDFDILFIKPIPKELLKLGKNTIGIFMYEEHIAIGFIFSHKDNIIYDYLLNKIKNILEKQIFSYQQFGANIWTELHSLLIIKTFINLLSNSIVYSYLYFNLNLLYGSMEDVTTRETIGIHWYNGVSMSKDYINRTDFSLVKLKDYNSCIMDSFILKVLVDIQSTEFKGEIDTKLVNND